MCRWQRGPWWGVGFLPAGLGALMLIAIISTYMVGALNNHVEAFFPYISDMGVKVPESCIFSQLFNMAAGLGVMVMYLRYKLIHALTEEQEEPRDHLVRRLSKVNLVIANFSCLGLSMVANFQETKIEPAHLTGAVMVFGLGVIYAFMDTYISYRMYPTYNGKIIVVARFLVGLLGLIGLLISIIAGTISRYQWAADPPNHPRIHWQSDDPGFIAHLCSTFGEWAVACSFLFYYITFIRDFQRFTIEINTVLYVQSHLDETPSYLQDHTHVLDPPIMPDERSPLLPAV